MTVTFAHGNAYDSDEPGVYSGGIEIPSGAKAWGAWAEAVNQYGNRSSHYSCTPTDPSATHISAAVQSLGTSVNVSGSTVYMNFLFRGDPGQMIRIHSWVLT